MSAPRSALLRLARRHGAAPGAVPLALALAAAVTSARAAPPTEPGGLRVEVYSSTALELFWQRSRDPDGAVRGYEIRRDGELLDTRDALSYFVEGLAPGTDARFGVAAIDFDGERSAVAEIRASTAGGDGPGSGPNAPAGEVPSPANARIEVYSSTAAELFWERPPAAAGVRRTEVSRDGAPIGETDGTSFFDGARAPGERYRYALVAVAADGTRSATAVVDETGPGTDDPDGPRFLSPIVDEWNSIPLAREAFSILSGRAFGQDVVDLPGFGGEAYAGGAPADAVGVDRACQNGGTVRIEPFSTGAREITSGYGFAFDDCQDGATLYDGELERRVNSAVTVVSSGIDVDGPGRDVAFAGSIGRQFTSSRDGGPSRFFAADVDRFERSDVEGTFAIENASIDYLLALPFRARLEGGFDYRSALTQRRTVEVRIVEPFVLDNEAAELEAGTARPFPLFEGGRLEIRAEDGSSLAVVVADDSTPVSVELILGGPFVAETRFRRFTALGGLEDVLTPFAPQGLF